MLKILYILGFSFIALSLSLPAFALQSTAQQALAGDLDAQAVQDDELPDGDLDLPEGDYDEEPAADEEPAEDEEPLEDSKKDKDAKNTEDKTTLDDKSTVEDKTTVDNKDSVTDEDNLPNGADDDNGVPDLDQAKVKDDSDSSHQDKPRKDLVSPWDEEANHATRPVIGGAAVDEIETGGHGRVGEADNDASITEEAWFWPVVGGGAAVLAVGAAVGGGFLVYSMLNADKGSVTIVLE